MRAKVVIVMAVLGAMLVCTGAAYAQYGGYGKYGAEQAKPYLRAKVGWFEPNESDLDGALAFGVDYIVPHEQMHLLYLSVDRLHAEDTAVETTAWSIMGGAYIKLEGGYYYGGGIGWSRHKLEQGLLPDRDDDGFAWEVGAGANLGRNGFGEIKYRDGGEDGNKGFILYLGTNLDY